MSQVREPLAFKEKKSLQERKVEADQIRTKVKKTLEAELMKLTFSVPLQNTRYCWTLQEGTRIATPWQSKVFSPTRAGVNGMTQYYRLILFLLNQKQGL